jgi:Tc toxin complex TcA C-terminal TcB-binding domain/Neuraminidase-like domain/Putative peptidoglycan binding domain/Salmonella virulence plasmid 28.1kDa A protein
MNQRRLAHGASGEDVARLQDALASIGIEISDEERERRLFGDSTEEAVKRVQRLVGIEATGEVDPQVLDLVLAARERTGDGPRPAEGPFVVRGRVLDANGLPMPKVAVVARQVTLRDGFEVGRDETDEDGRYAIEYSPRQPDPAATSVSPDGAAPPGPDLQLQVLDAAGKPVFESAIQYHLPRRAEVPLPTGGPRAAAPSEFDQGARTLSALRGKVPLQELEENDTHRDLTFLGTDSGLGRATVALHAVAAHLGESTELPPELFFALFRENVPADAEARALAAGSDGVDLETNAQRLLTAVLITSPEARAKAVEVAVEKGTVPPTYAERAKEDLERLTAKSVDAALDSAAGTGKTPIREVLSANKIDADKQKTFVERWTASGRPTRGFWRQLEKEPGFSREDVADIRFATEVGRITRGHMPLLEEITEMRGRNQIRGARDLARLSADDWKKLLRSQREEAPIGIPKNFTAKDDGAAVDAYAHLLERTLERTYPTTAFSARLAEDPEAPLRASGSVAEFLDANPAFDLRRTNVDRYLRDNPSALNGNRGEVRESLLTGQRVMKLASRYAVARPLLADGIDSAQQVYSMGQARFTASYADHPDVGPTEAARVYALAEQTYAMSLSVATGLNASIRGINPISIGNLVPTQPAAPEPEAEPAAPAEEAEAAPAPAAAPAPKLDDFPNLQTLFGSLDLCACKQCRSVLSPSAYFADMMRFLSHRVSHGKSAKEVLLERRPDLAQIELSCANTNTVMPYVDLVNELLEDAVAPPEDPAAARARQTSLPTPELNANPQYVNADAYAELAKAVHPWILPFDLPLLEARTYLDQIGSDRLRLMRALRRPSALPSPEASAEAVEALGFSAVEADIVTGGPLASANQPWDYWGLQESGNAVADPVDGSPVSGGWIDVLSHVRILLARGGLTHTELTRLLNTRFVNPGDAVTIECHPPDSCDLATMTVEGLTPDALNRIHRFVRLTRRLGWEPYDLDAAIAQLQGGVEEGLPRLNATLLRQLAAVKWAAGRFGISPREALALLGGIDTHTVPALPGEDAPGDSLYTTLFQNRAVLNPVDPTFELNGAGTEIAGIAANPTLGEHRETLLAALELSDDELTQVIDGLTDGKLTLANLSALYRHVLLARGLGLSVRELLALRALAETETDTAPFFEAVDPFDTGRPELLERFAETVEAVRRSGFEIAQLDYLLRDRAEPAAGLVPDDVTVGTLLKSLRDGLVKLAAENGFSPDPSGTQTRKRLAALMPTADAETLMAIMAGSSSLSTAEQGAAVSAKLGGYMPAADVAAALVGGAALDAGAPRYEYVLKRLLEHSRRTLGTGIVVQELAEALELPTATVAQLVGSWFRSSADAAKPLIDDFLALPGVSREPAEETSPVGREEAGFGPYFDAYAALDKAARTIVGLDFGADDVRWLREHGVGVGWLDLTTLPGAETATPEGRFTRWRRLADAAALKGSVPGDGGPFTGLMDVALGGATKAEYLAELSERTEWSAEDLAFLVGDPGSAAEHGSLGLTYPDDYRSERALSLLLGAFGQLRRIGVSAKAATEWIGTAVSAAQADAIKQSVKAKYTSDRWPEVAKPLRDVLRERQRDALVAYLLANPPDDTTRWLDANDVYARYLIDVEMGACQGTSRIVQANASIQLFVQRCILNLEPSVTVDAKADAAWLQWEWMSRYRVWEANRKVFLYPENWIEPGLRRDKSPFFQDLENELLQSEVTMDSAEDAFRGYLEKLDGVARLDVVGTYFEAGSPTRLHVIGRKQGDPPTYYYRQWIDSSRWTAWTKIDLDIVSDHVLPVVWNRRLYLFWAIVNRKPDQAQQIPSIALSGATPPPPSVHLELQLAWSELKGAKWQGKQTAPQTLVIRGESFPHQVTLKSSIADPLLRIDVFADDSWSNRSHVAEFVLGGVGNSVEAYATSVAGLADVGPDTRGIGALPEGLNKGPIRLPLNSNFDGMALSPVWTSAVTIARPRIFVCNTTYDLYGTLTSEAVLETADRYRLLVPHQNLGFDSKLPFFFSDSQRSYFVIPTIYYQNGNYFNLTTAPVSVYRPNYRAEYRFFANYHGFVPLFIRQLNAGGIDRLFEPALQEEPAAVQGIAPFDFRAYYNPYDTVLQPYPIEGVDFEYEAPYSIYNWELFYHAPFQIAESLSVNQRFADAKRWYEYVFDPTSTSSDLAPKRYWVTKTFRQMTAADYQAQEIQRLTRMINAHDAGAEHQVAEWRANPFEPHVIAGLRPVAYQRAIVMKYIDNLIAWGDQLFRQDTMESVNEATQLYVLAAELLGPKPEVTQPSSEPAAKTYAELEPSMDEFAAAAIAAAENVLPPAQVNVPVDVPTPQLPVFPPLYFCIPPNEKLMGYWDTVADRLFKIRHCMNIEGVTRQLALFAPPIDPGLLVKAAAAGLDLGSVLSDTSSALPPYRFRVMVREALQLAENVRALGGELLSALEKRDAEKLALIRSTAERKVQKAMVELRGKMIEEAEKQLDVLAKNRAVAVERQSYFAERKEDLTNEWEVASLALTGGSAVAQAIALGLESASGAAHMVVDAQFGASGAGGSPHVTVKFGGPNVGHGTGGFAKAAKVTAGLLQTGAAMSSVMAGYQRRKQEWGNQYDLATKELDAIDAQKLALSIRQKIAEKERDTEETQKALSEETDDFLHDKFTNQELYDWMVQQTSATYFQAYRLAYTVARQAEVCMRRELGLDESSYVQFGYWDSLKKGLLAGDKLSFDLQRMEAAYLTQNTRELELTKHASLRELDPTALVKLRGKGECVVTLPELWFDVETPGHYMRRLKSVAITVPCVVGPYGNVSLTATLLDNHVRTDPDPATPYSRAAGDDPRFLDDAGGTSAIVTSSGQNDAGVFELSHQDDRYLPFEGYGAVGTWKLKLNSVYPQFDYRTIGDVVLHLRYTARDAGAPLAGVAADAVRKQLNQIALAEARHGLYKLVNPRQELGSEWYAFLHPAEGEDQVLGFDLDPGKFPFFTSGLDLKVNGIDVFAKLGDPGDYVLELLRPGAPPQTVTLEADASIGGVHHWGVHPLAPKSDLGRAPASAPHLWSLKLKRASAADFRSLTAEEIEDLVIVFQYETAP